MTTAELSKKANWVRNQILEMIVEAKKGHIGGAFSCTDILVSLYYGDILRFDAKNVSWSDRDRFILSKGHSGVALYAVLADLGYFPVSELRTFCQNGSMLGGHPDRNVPGVEVDTGSLGHGLGIGVGMALGAKMNGEDYLVFVLLGDGECYEGSVWESAMFAAHHQLNNLIAIIDRNGQCVNDFTEDCNRLEPLASKWNVFGWDTVEVDGHSFDDIISALKKCRLRQSNKPLAVIAKTIKGKGVSFMEGELVWHHKVPSGHDLLKAQKELAEKD